MFTDTKPSDNSLVIRDTNPKSFDLFLDYIYGYEICVAVTTKKDAPGGIIQLFELADRYHVQGLLEALEEILLDKIGLETAAAWFTVGEIHSCKKLTQKVLDWIQLNLQVLLLEHEDVVKEFTETLWEAILKSNDVVVINEKQLFDALCKLPDEVQTRLLPLVRYYHMTPVEIEIARCTTKLLDSLHLINQIVCDKTTPEFFLRPARKPLPSRAYTQKRFANITFDVKQAYLENEQPEQKKHQNKLNITFRPNGDTKDEPDRGPGKVGIFLEHEEAYSYAYRSSVVARLTLFNHNNPLESKSTDVIWTRYEDFIEALGTGHLLDTSVLCNPASGFVVDGKVGVIACMSQIKMINFTRVQRKF